MVLHVDCSWVDNNSFLPGLREEFKLSSTLVDRNSGGGRGGFEFLKRFHVVSPQYRTHAMFERYSKANGKPPKLCKTPCNTSSIP